MKQTLKNVSLLDFATYDFKNEDFSEEIRNENNPLAKFSMYHNSKSNFDCDSSNGTCDLANEVYEVLWGFNYKLGVTMPLNLRRKFENWDRMGADTMNSFATTYINALHKIYNGDEDKLHGNELIQDFASLTHSVGNFTLVPFHLAPDDEKSFNQYRGYKPQEEASGKYFVYDYFDLSLKLIKENLDEPVFRNYINTFFLNDYVDSNYNVKPLFKGHEQFLKMEKLPLENPNLFHPKTEAELNEFLQNVLNNIMLRAERMISVIRDNLLNGYVGESDIDEQVVTNENSSSTSTSGENKQEPKKMNIKLYLIIALAIVTIPTVIFLVTPFAIIYGLVYLINNGKIMDFCKKAFRFISIGFSIFVLLMILGMVIGFNDIRWMFYHGLNFVNLVIAWVFISLAVLGLLGLYSYYKLGKIGRWCVKCKKYNLYRVSSKKIKTDTSNKIRTEKEKRSIRRTIDGQDTYVDEVEYKNYQYTYEHTHWRDGYSCICGNDETKNTVTTKTLSKQQV